MKNLSLPDLLSRSLTTTTQGKHRLRTVEIPDSIKFFMTHNQNTQPIQYHYAVSKEYINSVSTDTHVESVHFPIYLQIKDNCFKVQLENDLYLPVSHTEFKAKAQPLANLHQQKLQQFKNNNSSPENYPIIQHTDVTLNTDKTEPFTQSNHDANYAELINSIKFSLPAMGDFIPKSPAIYNYFYEEQTEIDDTLLYKTQQQDPVLRHLLFWKQYKNFPRTRSLTIRANKGLIHYYRRFQNLSINEDNKLLYYIQETTSPKICLPLSLLLVIFYIAHFHDLSGYPGREKTRDNHRKLLFSNIITCIAILTQDCLSCQTSKSIPNLLMAPLQPFLEVSPYFNHRISMDTKGPISQSSDGNSYVYVIVDAFTNYVAIHPSPKKDATNALTVLFDHWIDKFGIQDILVTDNGNEYINGELTHFCRTYNVQFKSRTPYAPWSNGLVENGNRQLNTFLRTVLDSQYDTWSH